MVSILKVSQNVTQIVYRFVPLQDFRKNSDIDWTKDVEEIDNQLFNKYHFTELQVRTIKENISSM